MPVRSAEKAGAWYPADPGQLAAELDAYLQFGEVRPPAGTPVAAIAPHAGLRFSGPCAGKAYLALRPAAPSTVIVFGAVHTMHLDAPAIWNEGAWETPFGAVPVDEDLARACIEAGVGEANCRPHYGDNAIELQLPFIRHCFPDAAVLPIGAPPAADAHERGRLAREVQAAVRPDAVAVGSTDLTHYGESFAFTPAGTGLRALEWAKENDRKLLDLMAGGKADAIVTTAGEHHSACGSGAAAATTAYADAAGATGTILEQTTSYDIMPDGEASHFVGYGSVIFVRS